MPAPNTSRSVVTLASDYQKSGDEGDNFGEEVEVESLPVATIEAWLMDPEPVEEWVRLKTKDMRVKLRGLTEEERLSIQKKAPKVPNKASRQMEPDQSWINTELVRRSLVEPVIPNHELLRKALSGDIAWLAKEIGRISGFDLDRGDALG